MDTDRHVRCGSPIRRSGAGRGFGACSSGAASAVTDGPSALPGRNRATPAISRPDAPALVGASPHAAPLGYWSSYPASVPRKPLDRVNKPPRSSPPLLARDVVYRSCVGGTRLRYFTADGIVPSREGIVSDQQNTPAGGGAGGFEGSGSRITRRRLLQTGLLAGAAVGVGGWRWAPGSPGGQSGRHGHLRQPGSLPYPNQPEGTDTIPQIEHIVVLMMENHSYDNKLGVLRRPDADGFRIGRDGLPLAENPYANGDIQHAFRMPTTCQLSGAPSQTWLDSHTQFDNGRNDGFVVSGSGPVAMGYWGQADQPFYYSLAKIFPIADRYFSSLLGQTYPNRRYLISATSIGMVNDTLPALTDYPANGTIFDRLDAAGMSWKDYYSTLPTTELYPQLYLKNAGTKVVPIADFFTDAAAGTLPGFCLVEPNYVTQSEEDPQNIAVGESSSPPRSSTPSWPARAGSAPCWCGPTTSTAATTTTCRRRRPWPPTTSPRRPRRRVRLQRLRPVRLPGALRGRLAVGEAAVRLAPDLRPHQHLRAGRSQMEPGRHDLPGRQRQPHARYGRPAPPGVPQSATPSPAPARHRPPRAGLQRFRTGNHTAARISLPAAETSVAADLYIPDLPDH